MGKSSVKVLLVEDNMNDARIVQEMLQGMPNRPFELTHVESLVEALHQMVEENYDVVLVDLTLPEAHGTSTLDHLQTAQRKCRSSFSQLKTMRHSRCKQCRQAPKTI